MEPLVNLSTLKDWKKYTPVIKGYAEAPAGELKKANITVRARLLFTPLWLPVLNAF